MPSSSTHLLQGNAAQRLWTTMSKSRKDRNRRIGQLKRGGGAESDKGSAMGFAAVSDTAAPHHGLVRAGGRRGVIAAQGEGVLKARSAAFSSARRPAPA